MSTLTANAPAQRVAAVLSENMKGFLIALENRKEVVLYTPATANLAASLLSYLSEDDFVAAAESFDKDDDLMDAVNLVEPFYVQYFTDNRDDIKGFLRVTKEGDEDHDCDAGYDYIFDEIDRQFYREFTIEHVKVAFNSPKNTTIETLDDSDVFDDVYYYTSEFASAIVARSICLAYISYSQLALG